MEKLRRIGTQSQIQIQGNKMEPGKDSKGNIHKSTLNTSSSPPSSQMSALLFSFSSPQPPAPKTAKLEKELLFDRFTSDEDEEEEENEWIRLLENINEEEFNISPNANANDNANANANDNDNANSDANANTNANDKDKSYSNEDKVDIVNTLNYCVNESDIDFSPLDSLYATAKSNTASTSKMLPMIDLSTPQIVHSQPQKQSNSIFSSIKDLQRNTQSTQNVQLALNTNNTATATTPHNILLLPDTFNITDLQFNLKLINPSIHLNPIEAIKRSSDRRIPFPLGLMLRDSRQIGSMAQLRLIDGNCNEIVGTLPFTLCSDLKIKLHFGLIFILIDVSSI